ncbi:hypothetical protein L914_13432 [Phytophthora nicotianae]|nr:hypothetical protein L916_13530 [Phytophthora nicotianae]ETM40711.1 hypothetical protein L914_13432 [Phytophthora nicotianae]
MAATTCSAASPRVSRQSTTWRAPTRWPTATPSWT